MTVEDIVEATSSHKFASETELHFAVAEEHKKDAKCIKHCYPTQKDENIFTLFHVGAIVGGI